MGGTARTARTVLSIRRCPGMPLAVGLLPILAGDLAELLAVVLPTGPARSSSLGR